MSTQTETLLENARTESTDSTYSYGDKKKGAGYHKNNDGVHTAVIRTDSFIGSVKIQGTLVAEPGEEDWLDIDGTEVGLGADSTLFLTDTKTISFTGKYVWIRAAYNLQNGTITKILYNY